MTGPETMIELLDNIVSMTTYVTNLENQLEKAKERKAEHMRRYIDLVKKHMPHSLEEEQ